MENIDYARMIFPIKKVFSYGDIVFTHNCKKALKNTNDDLNIYKKIIEVLEESTDGDELLTTMCAYYLDFDCKINDTAQFLFLHRNTIQYRLNKIWEITNYNPSNSFDVSLLQTATACYRLGFEEKI